MILLYSLLIMNNRAYSLCSEDLLHFIILKCEQKWSNYHFFEVVGHNGFLLDNMLIVPGEYTEALEYIKQLVSP